MYVCSLDPVPELGTDGDSPSCMISNGIHSNA